MIPRRKVAQGSVRSNLTLDRGKPVFWCSTETWKKATFVAVKFAQHFDSNEHFKK